MAEMILALAALLLALFCWVHSVRQEREQASPQPGPDGARKGRRAVYTAMLAALSLDAALCFAAALWRTADSHGDVPQPVGAAHAVLQAALLAGFVLYAILTLKRRGPEGTARRGDRPAVLLLLLTAAAGAAIRLIWGVRVELFFEAFALFGCAALLEPDGESPGRGGRFHAGAALAIALTLLAVIGVNAALILNISNAQSDEIGNTQLDVIRSDLEDTITEAETGVLRVAIGAEQLMESGATREALTEYIYAQRNKYLSSDSFLNVYVAGRDWHIVPDFVAPEGFHASERVWYVGAQDCPGEVYISEPYLDANTGEMCFTVSTMLFDGETVVGMDLNFSKA